MLCACYHSSLFAQHFRRYTMLLVFYSWICQIKILQCSFGVFGLTSVPKDQTFLAFCIGPNMLASSEIRFLRISRRPRGQIELGVSRIAKPFAATSPLPRQNSVLSNGSWVVWFLACRGSLRSTDVEDLVPHASSVIFHDGDFQIPST